MDRKNVTEKMIWIFILHRLIFFISYGSAILPFNAEAAATIGLTR